MKQHHKNKDLEEENLLGIESNSKTEQKRSKSTTNKREVQAMVKTKQRQSRMKKCTKYNKDLSMFDCDLSESETEYPSFHSDDEWED